MYIRMHDRLNCTLDTVQKLWIFLVYNDHMHTINKFTYESLIIIATCEKFDIWTISKCTDHISPHTWSCCDIDHCRYHLLTSRWQGLCTTIATKQQINALLLINLFTTSDLSFIVDVGSSIWSGGQEVREPLTAHLSTPVNACTYVYSESAWSAKYSLLHSITHLILAPHAVCWCL